MIDLHVHTTYSDGTFTPSEVVRYAKKKGLLAIAITDHDCVLGVDEAQGTGNKFGVEVIAGVEFSVNYANFHIIGLMIDIHNPCLKETIVKQTETVEKATERLFERLIACGFKNISYDEFRTQGPPSSKGHYKQYMATAKISTDNKELVKHIGKDGFTYACTPLKEWLTVGDAVDVIHNAGGIAIWAHPLVHKLNLIELEQTVMTFKAMGLDGVETYYPGLTQEDFRRIVDLADKHQLLISGGSDFHGEDRQNDLGTSYQNEGIPYSVLSEIQKAKKRVQGTSDIS